MVNALDLHNEVTIRVLEPLKIASFNKHGELLVLPDGAVLDLVHLVELALEEHEVAAVLRLLVHEVGLELLERVDDLEEVAVVKEEAEVTLFSLLDDGLDWHGQRILVKVVLQCLGLVALQPNYTMLESDCRCAYS